MIASANVNDVLIAAITAIPAIIAAVCAGVVVVRTKMPNGTKLGETVAHAAERSRDTNERVRRIEDEAA